MNYILNRGGAKYNIQSRIKTRINLSKGKLIFTENLNYKKNNVIAINISETSPEVAAIKILEKMSRRYL